MRAKEKKNPIVQNSHITYLSTTQAQCDFFCIWGVKLIALFTQGQKLN